MKHRSTLTSALLAGLCTGSAAAAPLIGLNLTAVNYFTEETVFTDLSEHFKPLHAQKRGADFRVSDPGGVVFDASGHPSFIAADHVATTIWDRPSGSVGGLHEVRWDGSGSLEWNRVGSASTSGSLRVNLDQLPGNRQRQLIDIRSTDPGNPLRNLRVVPVATGGSAPAGTFQPAFLDRWSQFKSFRYMDWADTNNSDISTWNQRAKPTDFTQAGRGVSLELQIEHANTTGTDPWFNLPHLADDAYFREAATLIRDRLDPGLTARIEYSNEVWNANFEQSDYATEQGRAENVPGRRDNLARLQWYSNRSVEMFDVFEDVFTDGGADPDGMDRLVRVMGAQAANPWVGRQVLDHKDAFRKVDALAIAPYFGDAVPAGPEAEAWKSYTLTERVAQVEAELQEAFGHMDAYAELLGLDAEGSRPYGDVELFAYEGGQHFLGRPDTHRDDELTAVFAELNRMDEMENFYLRYLEHWEEVGGSDFMLFSSVSDFGRFGHWGLLETEDQLLADAPKLRGVLRYLESRAVVPEPASALALLAAGPLLLRRRRPAPAR